VTQTAQIEDAVDLPQQMIDRNPVVETKFIEELLLQPACCPIIPRFLDRFDDQVQNT
jgi:hypothetical protein